MTAVATRAPSLPRARTPVLAWSLAVWSLAAAVGAVVIGVAWPIESPEPYSLVLGSVYPLVGALIASREPRNAVGWLLIAIGLTEACSVLAIAWAPVALDVSPGTLPGGQVAAWLADWLWMPGHDLLLTFLPLLFPDGLLPSKRWWPLAVLAAVALSLRLAAPMTVLPQLRLRHSAYEFYPDERLATALGTLGYDLLRVAAIGCVVALLWRLWRMPADRRGPYVWFAGGAALTVLLVVPIAFITDAAVLDVVRVVAVLSLPAGAAVAILRHKAYGIDVVVNRTLVYLGLSAVLVAVYLGSAALVDALIEEPGTVATVGAAAATALVFTPLRDRLQRVVDRLMYGDRDRPHDVVSAIGSRLGTTTTDVLADAAAHIATSLRLPYVGIELADPAGVRLLAASGAAVEPVERLPLLANGAVVGHLAAGVRRGQARLSERDRAALEQVASIAAAAVRQVQLTDELRRARGRLASSLEDERRRIRRDLHDGLGPALATVVMGLEEARAVHRDDPDRTEELLLDLKGQTRRAVEDIRALVYGLRPPALDDLGLLGAVQQLVSGTAARTGIRVEVEAPGSLPALPAAIEVAAFRIVQEALTNVVRHAAAGSAVVTLACEPGELRVRVRDDGSGLPDRLVLGVGLTSIRERAEDVGGTVTITSDGGTVVDALLPVVST
ncbi:MAG: sensor histidine kinase [Actinobacteria bacterium]|nr:sensor histidine kinase [Actinomycetota bacterium]